MQVSVSDKGKDIAAGILGMPSRVVAGKAASETIEVISLVDKINTTRAALPSAEKRSGNIAAVLEIDGVPSSMVAFSRIDTPKYGLVGPVIKISPRKFC